MALMPAAAVRAIRNAFAESRHVAIQSAVGYGSASLGLLCELMIATKFGANHLTDTYRWAMIIPFYGNSFVGSFLCPLYFRSQLARQPSRRLFVFELGVAGDCRFAWWVKASAWSGGIAVVLSAGMGLASGAVGFVYLQSCLLAFALTIFSIMCMPMFYSGWIWVNVAAAALMNASMAAALATPMHDLRAMMIAGMAISALVLLLLPSWTVRHLGREALEDVARRSAGASPISLRQLAIVAANNMSAIASTVIYFFALSGVGPGVLSVFTTTQKASLVLGVPAGAVVNRFIREDIRSDADVDTISRAARDVRLVVVMAPFFAVVSIALLAAVYRVDLGSSIGRLIVFGCAATAGLTAISTCMTMVTLGHRTGRFAAVPTAMVLVSACIGGAVIAALGRSEWAIIVPIVAGAATSAAGLAWVSLRMKQGRRSVALLVSGCFVLAVALVTILSSRPVTEITKWIADFANVILDR